mmetsp:Transcript_6554/g.11240  ORF Transcript_6554/g.11240 Transcript_6554/m.11240 type:complete len:313 (+) Transcript_6554:139-1077(+)
MPWFGGLAHSLVDVPGQYSARQVFQVQETLPLALASGTAQESSPSVDLVDGVAGMLVGPWVQNPRATTHVDLEQRLAHLASLAALGLALLAASPQQQQLATRHPSCWLHSYQAAASRRKLTPAQLLNAKMRGHQVSLHTVASLPATPGPKASKLEEDLLQLRQHSPPAFGLALEVREKDPLCFLSLVRLQPAFVQKALDWCLASPLAEGSLKPGWRDRLWERLSTAPSPPPASHPHQLWTFVSFLPRCLVEGRPCHAQQRQDFLGLTWHAEPPSNFSCRNSTCARVGWSPSQTFVRIRHNRNVWCVGDGSKS